MKYKDLKRIILKCLQVLFVGFVLAHPLMHLGIENSIRRYEHYTLVYIYVILMQGLFKRKVHEITGIVDTIHIR